MRGIIKRLASYLGPPWGLGSRLPAEPVRGEFNGLLRRLYVTQNWVVVKGPFEYYRTIRLVDIAQVESGFDPSPWEDGVGWGIWIKEKSGKECEVGLFKPHEAGSLIRSLRTTAIRRERGKSGVTDTP